MRALIPSVFLSWIHPVPEVFERKGIKERVRFDDLPPIKAVELVAWTRVVSRAAAA